MGRKRKDSREMEKEEGVPIYSIEKEKESFTIILLGGKKERVSRYGNILHLTCEGEIREAVPTSTILLLKERRRGGERKWFL